jgi:hypothetical protein
MIYPEKTNIFICDSIEDDSITYRAILQNLCEEIDEINVMRKEKFAAIEESEAKETIRFGCVTPDTPTFLTESLVKQAIPVLFFGPDDRNQYEMLLVRKHKIEPKELHKMIYNISQRDEISGAIKWVHTYYYHLCEYQVKKTQERKRLIEEIRREIASEVISRD